jgi:hypothetical protein
MHPWEDWAETWAHVLHMVDTLQTARAYGLPLGPRRDPAQVSDFDDLLGGWVPLTLAMNSLNRSMGLADAYPFVLSEAAVDKLRFVHRIVQRSRGAQPQPDPVART